jgi:hypothetical protein
MGRNKRGCFINFKSAKLVGIEGRGLRQEAKFFTLKQSDP